MYSYNFAEGKYWINISNKCPDEDEVVVTTEEKKVDYYSSTGQFISNHYFFIEGTDSENVSLKIKEIYDTLSNLDSIKSISHLENMDFIATYTFKYIIQNNTCELDTLIQATEYLIQTSQYLSSKIGQKSEQQKSMRNTDNFIPRCSYKFCHYTHYCQYNYPEKNNKSDKGCYSDHYVYSKLSQDVQSLLQYINKTYSGQKEISIRNNQEVIKCINTITFVIKHMYDELWNIYISCSKEGENYETLHKNISN